MAIPSSTETPRTLHLQSIVLNVTVDEVFKWPAPTANDLVLIANIITSYSHIDLNLRRMIEVLELVGAVPTKWKTKTGLMPIGDVETVLQASPPMQSGPNQTAFQRLREIRKTRNLVAHFVIRRFVNENAFIFLTKSEADYRRTFGTSPEPGVIMTAVSDAQQLAEIERTLAGLRSWTTAATSDMQEWLDRI